jgi:hypothetical protein
MVFSGLSFVLGEMPGVAPVAAIGAELRGGVGRGDLVGSRGQGLALGRVFALAADRAFGCAVHAESFQSFLSTM